LIIIKAAAPRPGSLFSMLGLPIKSVLEPRKLVVAAPHTTVAEAANLMKKGNVGAVLVVDEGRLVGIFTERDALFRVVAPGLEPAKTKLCDVMTRDPITVAPDETFGYALLLMHDKGFRHTPVVENGRPVGVVSARHALDPDLEEFAAEAERRKHIRRRA
jgi:CBS domain-containing protein